MVSVILMHYTKHTHIIVRVDFMLTWSSPESIRAHRTNLILICGIMNETVKIVIVGVLTT